MCAFFFSKTKNTTGLPIAIVIWKHTAGLCHTKERPIFTDTLSIDSQADLEINKPQEKTVISC